MSGIITLTASGSPVQPKSRQRGDVNRCSPATFAIVIALMAVLQSLPLNAHPGHGDPVMVSGTVTAIEPTRVQIETFDRASARIKRVWVVVEDTTVVRVGKSRLTVAELRVGQKVDCAGETDLGPNEEPLVRAITFRLKSK